MCNLRGDIAKKISAARMIPPEVLIETGMRLTKRKIRSGYIKNHPVKLSDKDFLNVTGYKYLFKAQG